MSKQCQGNLIFPRTGHKQIDDWLNLPWPAVSIDDARRFGKASALLYYYLHKEVETPDGKGVLLQVLGKNCFVAFGKEGVKFAYGRRYFAWQISPDIPKGSKKKGETSHA